MKRAFFLLLLGASLISGSDWQLAERLYLRTEYRQSLAVLQSEPPSGGPAHALIGKNLYMLGDYKQATEAFQKASVLDPANAEYVLWTGRCYGRRAETASPFLAPANATKARQLFEKAVELDPRNEEALNDLFAFYLQAPSFLGGGFEKAAALAKRIGEVNPAEYHFAQARIAEKKNQYDTAEEQLRRAIALAPRQVGRFVDLARYLAKQGRYQESDAAFQQAEKIAPNSPRVLFDKAHSYIEQKRNLDEAKLLLQRYLQSNTTPDDPPKDQARKLLKQVSEGV